jgi:glycosyltransferase involved in cell wall biosynthesis
VIYGARHEPRNQWPEECQPPADVSAGFLADEPLVIRGRSTYASPRVIPALAATRPDAVIMGGYAPWLYWAGGWCRVRRVPFVIWSAETLDSIRAKPRPAIARRPLWSSADGFLAYGPAARDYLVQVGKVPSRKITVLGNGIDIGAFAAKAESIRPKRDEIRRQLGLQGRIILSVGGKNVELVISAARALPPPVSIIVVGREVPAAEGHPMVRALGRVDPHAMADLYVAADCLAHLPQFDLWPHAVNEALAAGLPVVASRLTGAPDDLFSGPGSALVDLNREAVTAAFSDAFHAADLRDPAYIEAVRAPSLPWGVDVMAPRLVSAVESAVARKRS